MEREKTAYSAFRGGFRPGTEIPPHWDDLPSWVRDAVVVAYAQGKLDAKTNAQVLSRAVDDQREALVQCQTLTPSLLDGERAIERLKEINVHVYRAIGM